MICDCITVCKGRCAKAQLEQLGQELRTLQNDNAKLQKLVNNYVENDITRYVYSYNGKTFQTTKPLTEEELGFGYAIRITNRYIQYWSIRNREWITMPDDLSKYREIAARIWCDKEFKNVTMDVEAAEKIAEILKAVEEKQNVRS